MTLVVINPRSLNERQRWEINRAPEFGQIAVMAVQNYEWDYHTTRDGNRISRRDEKPQVNELLEKYGLKVSEDILMDVNSVTLTVQSQAGGLIGALMGQPFNLPTHILVNNTSMNQNTSITNRLAAILYLWGTALDINQEKTQELGLEYEVLMSTSDKAWSVGAADPMTQASFEPPSVGKAFPLMVVVRGQFPDAYKDVPRPACRNRSTARHAAPPPEPDDTEPPAPAVEAKPGRSCADGLCPDVP